MRWFGWNVQQMVIELLCCTAGTEGRCRGGHLACHGWCADWPFNCPSRERLGSLSKGPHQTPEIHGSQPGIWEVKSSGWLRQPPVSLEACNSCHFTIKSVKSRHGYCQDKLTEIPARRRGLALKNYSLGLWVVNIRPPLSLQDVTWWRMISFHGYKSPS